MSRESPRRDVRPPGYRLTVLGSGAVGKTAILNRFLNDEFIEKHKETVEDLHIRTFDLNGQHIQTRIFDTAGNMQFPAMRRLSIENAQAFILVYDVTCEGSFGYLQTVISEIKELRIESELNDLPIVIVGNKCDLPSDRWVISSHMVKKFMLNETIDLRAVHIEASAKTGYNVRAAFETLVRMSPLFLGMRRNSSTSWMSTFDFVRSTTMNGPPGQWRTPGNSPAHKVRERNHTRRFSLQPGRRGSVMANGGNGQNDTGITTDQWSHGQSDHVESRGNGRRMSNDFQSDLSKKEKRMKLFRKSKTKSHDEYDTQECNVQ